MRVIKHSIHILFVSIICFLLLIPPLFASNGNKVIDDAELFTSSEIELLNTQIESLCKKYNHDFIIHTTETNDGKSCVEYADDYYDNNGYGYGPTRSGIILVIDINSRIVTLSTLGDIRNTLTDDVCDSICYDITPALSSGDYFEASSKFLADCDQKLCRKLPLTKHFCIAFLVTLVMS